MINSISSRTCGNVYSILTELSLFEKIPTNIQNFIVKNKADYKFTFNKNIPLQSQVNDKETMVVLSYLFLKYINDNADTEKYLVNKYRRNESIYQKELREKYNPDDIFKNIKKEKNTNIDNLPIEVKKEKFYEKIIKFFKRIFKLD